MNRPRLRLAFGVTLLSLLCATGLDRLITAGNPRYWEYRVDKLCNQVKPGMPRQSAMKTTLAMGEPAGMSYVGHELVVVGTGFASCTIRLDSSGTAVEAVELKGAPFSYSRSGGL